MNPASRTATSSQPEPVEVGLRPDTYEDVFRADHEAVVAVAWALTGSRAVAEELAQEAFLRAHQRWPKVGRLDNPGAWVRRVTINLAHSDRRRRQAEARALLRREVRAKAAVIDDESELVADAASFWAAVRSLPDRQGAVIALHYLEDRSVADISIVLGIAPGTVKAHLHKARAALAARLELNPQEDQ